MNPLKRASCLTSFEHACNFLAPTNEGQTHPSDEDPQRYDYRQHDDEVVVNGGSLGEDVNRVVCCDVSDDVLVSGRRRREQDMRMD